MDGVFDMLHHGHINAISQAKRCFPNTELIIGVNSDTDTKQYHGLYVMTGAERVQSVKAIKGVDKIVYPAPWFPTKKFIEDNYIDFVAHDEQPYICDEIGDFYFEAKLTGKFIRTFRTPDISTSELIQRIIKDREKYILFMRAKGFTNQQMNVATSYYIVIVLRYYIKELKKKIASVFCFWRKRESVLPSERKGLEPIIYEL